MLRRFASSVAPVSRRIRAQYARSGGGRCFLSTTEDGSVPSSSAAQAIAQAQSKAKVKIKAPSASVSSILCGEDKEKEKDKEREPSYAELRKEREQHHRELSKHSPQHIHAHSHAHSAGHEYDDDGHESDEEARRAKEEKMKKAEKKAMFVTQVGAVANISLAISKGIIGFLVSSTALIADAANSLGDVLCDGVVYYSVKEARKTATPDRPWGRGKIESIGALSVGGLLCFTGIGIGYSALLAGAEILDINAYFPLQELDMLRLFDAAGGTVDSTTSTVHSAQPHKTTIEPEKETLVELAALGISGLSVAAKEVLFRYTLKVGQEANSSAVIANAHQHRADAVASSAVFAGLVGSMMGFPILDPVAGVLVAGLIVKQAYTIGHDALRDLSDAPAEARETAQLRETCLQVNGVLSVENVLARKSGPFLFVEATIGVDGSISASAAHRIAELTKLELMREHTGRVANAVVHVTPLGSSGLGESYPSWARDHDFIVAEIKRAVLPIKEIHAVSEVQVYYKDNGLISTKVDILLPPNLTIHQAHAIAVKARMAIEEVLPGIGDVDVDLELDEA